MAQVSGYSYAQEAETGALPLPGLSDFSFEVPAKHTKCFSPPATKHKITARLSAIFPAIFIHKIAGGRAIGTVLMELYA